MQSIVNFLRSAWSVWTICIYLLIVSILWILFYWWLIYVVPKSRWSENFIIWLGYRVVTPVTFAAGLLRVKSYNHEHIDWSKPYVIIGNHNSSLDIMANLTVNPTLYKYLSKIEVTKIPIAGKPMSYMMVAVDRKDPESRKKCFDEMKKVLLKDQMSIFIYPEGTRNKTKDLLLEFKKGAFSLAVDAQIPILMATAVGGKKIQQYNRPLDLAPGTYHIHWEAPIETKGMTSADVSSLMEKCRNTMLATLEKHLDSHQPKTL